jgi:glycosyltransferase involved in cell wall biosynthesis
MTSLAIVFPMFWGREKNDIYHPGDHFYDHPTALDDDGTIPALFESFAVLKDRDFEIIAVAGASHPSIETDVQGAAARLLRKHAREADVPLHLFSYSHVNRLHQFLRKRGEDRLVEAVSLLGYSPLRNACLVAAHILGMEIAVSIDDDCVFIDPDYLSRIRRLILSDFDGRPILACCGPYRTAKDTILLDLPSQPHTAYWNVLEAMNAAFKHYIVEAPGLQEVPFAIMGNIAVHRDFFTRCPLDPPMRRGEDMDWVMNAHILGERFVMDPGLVIKHLPPPRPHPTWRPMREDIHRFLYQRAKIDHSHDGEGIFRLERERYVPYPGAFFQDDFRERAARASLVLATDYLAQGQPEDATESLANVLHAYRLGQPEGDPFQDYLEFQAKWVSLMEFIGENRKDVRALVFG